MSLSFLFAISLLSWHVASQSNSTTAGPTTTMGPADASSYCIGDDYNLQWSNTSISAETVNVVLYYENSTWTMATGLPNTGSAIVGRKLGNSAQQLFIANGTMGEFRVEADKTELNRTESLSVKNVSICQSVIFDTPGRAIASGTDAKGVVVTMKQSRYYKLMQAGAKWVASFVTIAEDGMTWSTAQALEFFPVSGTPSPTALPTAMPTKAPSAAQTDPEDPAKPTTFFSTASPTKAQKGLKLADAMSIYQVSLGMDDVDGRVGLRECRDAEVGDDWCQVNMTVKVPEDTISGGPYDLIVGLTANATSWQYYGVNMDPMNEGVTQFLAYNASAVDITLSKTNMVNDTIYKYEDVDMKVTLGDSFAKSVPVYVVATQHTFVDDFTYVLECGMEHNASYFTAFGWKTWAINGFEPFDKTDLPQGSYEFELYWAATSEYESVVGNNLYRLNANLSDFSVHDDANGTVKPAVSIKDDKFSFSRGSNKIDFLTSFNDGTVFSGYIEQCRYMNTTNSTVCRKYGNSTFNFTSSSSGNKVTVDFPESLYYTKIENNSLSESHFVISTTLCDDVHELVTEIPLEITKKKSSGGSSLSAGAIVGIVCAGVLVLGLAAWWLCMKKSNGDGYRELNE